MADPTKGTVPIEAIRSSSREGRESGDRSESDGRLGGKLTAEVWIVKSLLLGFLFTALCGFVACLANSLAFDKALSFGRDANAAADAATLVNLFPCDAAEAEP
jgi:hypothetical protein